MNFQVSEINTRKECLIKNITLPYPPYPILWCTRPPSDNLVAPSCARKSWWCLPVSWVLQSVNSALSSDQHLPIEHLVYFYNCPVSAITLAYEEGSTLTNARTGRSKDNDATPEPSHSIQMIPQGNPVVNTGDPVGWNQLINSSTDSYVTDVC